MVPKASSGGGAGGGGGSSNVSRKGKKRDVTPPKKEVVHIRTGLLTPLDTSRKYADSDLYYDSPDTKTSSSQFVVEMLDEESAKATRRLASRGRSLSPPGSRGDGKRRDGAADEAKGAKKGSSQQGKQLFPQEAVVYSDEEKEEDALKEKLRGSKGVKPDANAMAVAQVKKAMMAAQPHRLNNEERVEFYEKAYPYTFLSLKALQSTADSIERVYKIEALTGGSFGEGVVKPKTMDAVILACRYLEGTGDLRFEHSTFVDCLGSGGETALYASAFNFGHILSIEITEEKKAAARKLISNIEGLPALCTIIVGLVHDYFPFDAQVYYYDVTRVCDGVSCADEGLLIDKIFSLCKRAQVGSYLVLLSNIEVEAIDDFGATHMRSILKSTVHHGEPDQCKIAFYGIYP